MISWTWPIQGPLNKSKSQLDLGNTTMGLEIVVSVKVHRWLRGNDIGSGSVTDCLLRSFSDLKRQTELHYIGWSKNQNKLKPNKCHYPLITYLNITSVPNKSLILAKKLSLFIIYFSLFFPICKRKEFKLFKLLEKF